MVNIFKQLALIRIIMKMVVLCTEKIDLTSNNYVAQNILLLLLYLFLVPLLGSDNNHK
jgi:hypothetical protein